MESFLLTIVSFPTVVFTVLLGVAAVYWLFVFIGVVDIDGADSALDGLADGVAEGAAEGAAEGLAEGAAEGLAEGAAEGVADGVADGMADGVADGAADGMAEGAAEGGFAGFLSALRLRSAPVTVVFSVFCLFAWGLSYPGTRLLVPELPLPGFVTGLIVLVVASVVSLFLTSLAVRPLGPLFETHQAQGNRDLIGKNCIVRSGRVDETFGQAIFDEGSGAEMIIDVRCDEPNRLGRGSVALIIDHDVERHAFVVTPMDPLLKLPGGEDEA